MLLDLGTQEMLALLAVKINAIIFTNTFACVFNHLASYSQVLNRLLRGWSVKGVDRLSWVCKTGGALKGAAQMRLASKRSSRDGLFLFPRESVGIG